MPFLIKLNKPEVQQSKDDLFQNILLVIRRFCLLCNPELSRILNIQIIKAHLWEYNVIHAKFFFSPLCRNVVSRTVQEFANVLLLFGREILLLLQSGNRQKPVRRERQKYSIYII